MKNNKLFAFFLLMVLIPMISCRNDEETFEMGFVFDIDNNVYSTVKIGDQVWMTDNLRTNRYQNGDIIPIVTDSIPWTDLKTGAYCDYKNDADNSSSYGHLYNWYSVVDSCQLAPIGWHVPTQADVDILIAYIASKDDETKFAATYALSWDFGGLRGNSGVFSDLGKYGIMWCTTEVNEFAAWKFWVTDDFYNIGKEYEGKDKGFSVRCVKD